tara:strand:- start:349 stop:1200 length:852 start_codon:yes stop_codon:yes gene_type:complete
MLVLRIMMLAFAAASLAFASTSPAQAHPPEEHSGTAVAIDRPAAALDPVAASEPAAETPVDAVPHDQAAPHGHDAASAHQENAVPVDDPADAASPHDHDVAPQHDEAATHEHGTEAEAVHHEDAGHSHWGDDGANTPLEKALEALGAYHPLLVHFPIALILAAALAQALNLAGSRGSNADIVRFLVWTGAFGGLAAGLLGWAHAGPMASDEAGVMLAHRWIGSSLTLGLFGVAAAVEWHRKGPSNLTALVMNTALFTAAAAAAINGFLGGSLAHGGMNHLMEM